MRIYDASKQQFAVAMFVGVLNHFSLLSRFNAYKHMMTILYRFTHFPRPLQLHVFLFSSDSADGADAVSHNMDDMRIYILGIDIA